MKFQHTVAAVFAMLVLQGCPHPVLGDAGHDSGPDPRVAACASSLACNPISNDNCTGGQTCLVDHDLTVQPSASCFSVPDGGTVTLGSQCGVNGGGAVCGAGLLCQDGLCRLLCCSGDPTACQGPGLSPGSTCLVAVTETGLGSCNHLCDWTAATTGCGANETCEPYRMDGTAFCSPAGNLVEYDICSGHGAECGVGLYCARTASTTGGTSRCLRTVNRDLGAGACGGGYAVSGGIPGAYPPNFAVCVAICQLNGSGAPCPNHSTCNMTGGAPPGIGVCLDP